MKLAEFVEGVKSAVDKFAARPESESGINPNEEIEEEYFWDWFEDYVRSNGLK